MTTLLSWAEQPERPLVKVISGGQCGADQGGLVAAREFGLLTGGTAPKGWRTAFGPCPLLQNYGLVESSSYDYAVRTKQNIRDADFTLVIAFDQASPGTRMTTTACRSSGKPFYVIPLMAAVVQGKFENYVADQVGFAMRWLTAQPVEVLNVAGNRDVRDSTVMFDVTILALRDIFTRLEALNLLHRSIPLQP
jgi:Circularly permutated YpsA SLOG family